MFQKVTKILPFVVFKRTFWNKVCYDSLCTTCEILLPSVFFREIYDNKMFILANYQEKTSFTNVSR